MPQNPWELDWTGVKTAPAATATSSPGRAKTTPQDMMILRDSTAKAEAERAAQRDYAETRRAVAKMDTGPVRAAFMDLITPEQDGNIFDKIGGVLGTPLRYALTNEQERDARDRLKTISAQVALKGAQMQKGTASNADTALMRIAGVSDYKGTKENYRLLDDAARQSAIEGHRASLKAQWIGRYGSLSTPGPRGLSYEQIAAQQEKAVNQAMDLRQGLRKPPRSVTRRAPAGGGVYDINGNPVR